MSLRFKLLQPRPLFMIMKSLIFWATLYVECVTVQLDTSRLRFNN